MEEQEALDENDDVVSGYSIRIQRLITAATPSTTPDTIRVVTKQLALLQAKVESVSETIHTLDDEEDDLVYTLEEYRDQMIEIKVELTKLNTSLLTSEAAPEDAVMRDLAKTERTVFTCIITIKKRLRSINAPAAMPSETSTKTRITDVSRFQGDILRWKNFWEQFCVSVHEQTTIPKEEKLMYLQNAIKDKTAKNIIAGLTKSSDHYDEAIKCLKERYDRPRQIHQTHVRHIVEVPALRDGTGKEIRALHDIVTQHLRALKSLGHEPSQAFITSLLEMKPCLSGRNTVKNTLTSQTIKYCSIFSI